MGQHSSRDEVDEYSPFAQTLHTDACYLRKLVEKKDFVLFISELKVKLKDSNASPLKIKTIEHVPSPFALSNHDLDVSSYKVNVASNRYHYVYFTCQCPGRYIGMDINKLDNRGQTALHVAIRKHDHEIVRLLLDNSANPRKHNRWGSAPLHVASEIGDTRILTTLLKSKTNVDVKEKQSLAMFENQGRTPLIIASLQGHVQCVSVLLNAGADPNHSDTYGNTALHKACVYGNIECAKLLLELGACPNVTNVASATPIQLAMLHRHSAIVQLLLKFRANVRMYGDKLPTNVTLAAMTGESKVLQECIDLEENIDTGDQLGKTALYYTFSGDISTLKLTYPECESHGILFDIQYFQLNKRQDTLGLLIKHGADVEGVIKGAIETNALTIKHFKLPLSVELFRMCICACGFHHISDTEVDTLLWKFISSNSTYLVRCLLTAVPRLDKCVRTKLEDVVDWTGIRTDEAIFRYLEGAGVDRTTADWIHTKTKSPRSLQEWCRYAVRAQISSNVIYNSPKLRLPLRLQTYITLEELTPECYLTTNL